MIFNTKRRKINGDARTPSLKFVFVFCTYFPINKNMVGGKRSCGCVNPEPLFERLPLGVQLLRLVKCWRQDGSNISGGRRAASAKLCTGTPIEIMPAFSTGASSYSRGHQDSLCQTDPKIFPGFSSNQIFHTCHRWCSICLKKRKIYLG